LKRIGVVAAVMSHGQLHEIVADEEGNE